MRKIIRDKTDCFALTISILLFAFFLFFTKVQECGDSFQYLHQYPMREPVYALLLQFLQVCFGAHFGIALSIVQNTLAVVCIYWAYRRMSEIFNMNTPLRLCSLFLLLFPHILTPLASSTRLVLTTTIMTEGITYSLYYIWFVIILGILTGFYKDIDGIKIGKTAFSAYSIAYALSFLLSLTLALTRGQMLLCLIVWMIVAMVRSLLDKRFKLILIFLIVTACAFPLKSQLTRWYNLAETGFYVDTVSSKPMLLANILYVCDRDDAQYIEEADLREAFINMYDAANANKLTVKYADGNIIDMALYHESCHEPLNFEYIDPEIRKVIEARNGTNASQFLSLMIQEDELCAQIASQLLPHILGKYLKNYFVIVSLGFVRSIAVEKSFIPIFAVLMYLLAIILTVIDLVKEGFDKYNLMMLLVLLCIGGTVCGTSLMIECLHRYMIYNFPFFYIAGLVLLTHMTSKKK